MTDRVTVLAKCDEMILRHAVRLREACDRLIRSGGVNLEEYGDDYVLPKIILTAAIEAIAKDWELPYPEHRKVVKNLSHF